MAFLISRSEYGSSEIEPWKTKCHLSEYPVPRRIKHVVMHADETRDYAVAMKIEYLSVFRNVRRRSIAHRLNLSFPENDGLILSRGRPGAVDHAHVGEHNDRSINIYECTNSRRQRLCPTKRAATEHD